MKKIIAYTSNRVNTILFLKRKLNLTYGEALNATSYGIPAYFNIEMFRYNLLIKKLPNNRFTVLIESW